MSEELRDAFVAGMQEQQLLTAAGAVTAMDMWGISIPGILQVLIEKAKEMGREYRPQLEEAARGAVDMLVALDLPWVPESIEGVIDEATRQAGYKAITAILDAILA